MFTSTMNESQRTETTQMAIKSFIGRTDAEVLQLKLHYFGHLMRRAATLEKTLMLGKSEGRSRMGQQRMRRLDGITDSMDMSLSKLQKWQKSVACCSPWDHKELNMTL